MTDIGAIVLSHWHRDHSGGLLSAIRLASSGRSDGDQVIVALPPDKPAFRGIMFDQPISLEADPTVDEVNSAGGKTVVLDEARTILDDVFLISGEIPRQTEYEGGIPGGVRYDPAKDEWIKDELIMEERFVMCKLKGKSLSSLNQSPYLTSSQARVWSSSLAAVTPASLTLPGMLKPSMTALSTPSLAATTSQMRRLIRWSRA